MKQRLHQITEAIRALRKLDDPAAAARWGPWPLPKVCRCGHGRNQHPRRVQALTNPANGRRVTWFVRGCLHRGAYGTYGACACARYVPAWAAILGLREPYLAAPTFDQSRRSWDWGTRET